ncbi:M20 peptidase aminoacylase family protein [Litchfieldia alkalitelluris]|uniref:M20 peptidase aminoacylase family protein n=1 Tax=Litchfieldia alkalitelluris TaxID=304268 RepID=UPI000998B2CD|nr:M20 peptidase aminoacylase family protein [Litchfieldia alkalitelluris]
MTTLEEQSFQKEILSLFNYFHNHPEVSWKEYETTQYIRTFLQQFPCRVTTFPDHTGLIAEIGSGSPVIGIRADIDALWQEVDGVYQPVHSCGHDAHMTIVLGTLLRLLNKTVHQGTIRFIFQPAEEKGNGALKLIEKKVADDLDYLFGVHLRPYQELENGKASPAIYHGASGCITGSIHGDDMHGARPHLGVNAIEVGASLVQMLKQIVLNPMTPYSVKLTSFHAGGESFNVIPGSATFSIDLRAQTNEAMEELQLRIDQVFRTLRTLYNVEIKTEMPANLVAAEVNDEAQALLSKAIEEVLGYDRLAEPIVTTGGDDFHYYTVKNPSIKATMLGLGCDLAPGLHHPQMSFNKDAIFTGIDVLVKAVDITLSRSVGKERELSIAK